MSTELKDLMVRARLTLAAAESVTSGRLQAAVGAISGSSQYFLGGVTAYSLEQKVMLLGVERAAAKKVNCVSAEVAEQMARGVSQLFGSDFGVATTGYAEPAKEQGVASPKAWWAVARRKADGAFDVNTGSVEFPATLTRVEVQQRVAEAALAAVIAVLRAPVK